MHVANTERIITQILRQPGRFDMSAWITAYGAYSEDDDGDHFDPCGTTCCIAGWAVLNDETSSVPDPEAQTAIVEGLWHNEESVAWTDRACDILDLEPSRHSRVPLFYDCEWPTAYRDADEASAVVAATLMRHMLDGTVVYREDCDLPWWSQYAVNGAAALPWELLDP